MARYLKELKCIFRSSSVYLEVAEQSVGSIASTVTNPLIAKAIYLVNRILQLRYQ